MEIVSVSSLQTGSVLWQPRAGQWMLTVVSKATFLLTPKECRLAPEQQPIHPEDVFWEDGSSRALRAPNDLAPSKPRADIVLVGSAFAPGGAAVSSLICRLGAAEVEKSIEAFSDQVVSAQGDLQEGGPFSWMPIRWERAAGGPDTPNPLGVAHDARDQYGRRTLPNLRRPGSNSRNPNVRIDPVGFGPVAANWPGRAKKLGRHASTWSPDDWATRPMPEDFDFGYFNVAPKDQQVHLLRDDERIKLENLHREHARLLTTLPGIRPVAYLQGRSSPVLVELTPDTLWIDTDSAICTLTFRGQLQLEHPEEDGRILMGIEKPGQTVGFADLEGLAPARVPVVPAAPAGPAIRISADTAEFTAANLMEELNRELRARKMGALPFAQVIGSTPAHEPRADGALPFMAGSAAPVPPAAHPPKAPGAMGWAPPGSRSLPRPHGPAGAEPPVPRAANQLGVPATTTAAPPASPGTAEMPAIPPLPAPPASAARSPALSMPAMAMPSMPMQSMPAPAPSVPMVPGGPSAWAGTPPVATPPAPTSAAVPPPPPSQSQLGPLPTADSPWLGGASGSAMAGPAAAPPPPAVVPAIVPSVPRAGSSPLGPGGAAAAAAAEAWQVPRADGPAVAPPLRVEQRISVSRVFQLVWFEPDSVPRIRRDKQWRKILDELEQKPEDRDLDDPATADDPNEVDDKREIFEILAKGWGTDADGVSRALHAGIREDGKLAPQLVLLSGDLLVPFDELETLRATVTTADPLAAEGDENLKTAVLNAKDFLKNPDLLAPPGVSQSFSAKIREAFSEGKRTQSATYIEEQTDRVLLEKRHYQKRIVFGDAHLRALWSQSQGPHVPAYLPEALAKKLPMFQQFECRLIAEVHLRMDQYEANEAALRVVALARAALPPVRG